MRTTSGQRETTAVHVDPNPASREIQEALNALRAEWRAGFNGRPLRASVFPSLRRLAQLVPAHLDAASVRQTEQRLHDYPSWPMERRKAELVAAADLLKSIDRHIAALTSSTPVGKLNESVAPGRARLSPPAKVAKRSAGIRPLQPSTPITALSGVGEALAKKLANLGVETVGDLLRLRPRRYIDYSRTVKIGSILGFGGRDECTVRGEVTDIRELHGPGRPRVTIRLTDDTGWIKVTWFNTYITKQIKLGDEIAVSGLLDFGYGPPSFTSPEWEPLGAQSLSTGRLTPVYPLTQGLAQKTMRRLSRAALDATKDTIVEFLPASIRDQVDLIGLVDAYESIHYPDAQLTLARAQDRLTFDDMLLLELGLIHRRRTRASGEGIPLTNIEEILAAFLAGLPYPLTGAQQRALEEICGDLTGTAPMTRLLQGDVGSGKTVVAAAAALAAVANGYQVAVMAPTEILAEQHFHNFRGLFASLPEERRPAVSLLTGSSRASERRELQSAAEHGLIDVLVGTHALLYETVVLQNPGLVVIDEQHRFGVRQRARLPEQSSGRLPHLLSMTATPIPRTLNIVLHGDLDISIIDELPPGRIPIETRRYSGDERSAAYTLVREEVARGRQVFVICPLVEESEISEAKAAVDEAERLKRDVFPSLRIATLHGRLPGREKDRIMTAFRDHAFDILVSTSVIEVGIDVPNATVMMIEGADRFGLSQLHQFRGRVGRGGDRSYCLLVADATSAEADTRLDLMVETNNGFVLAEKDLELRGPGDFFVLVRVGCRI